MKRSCSGCIFRHFEECRHSPPVRLPRKFVSDKDRTRDEELIWGWPKIKLTDWCGSFKQ